MREDAREPPLPTQKVGRRGEKKKTFFSSRGRRLDLDDRAIQGFSIETSTQIRRPVQLMIAWRCSRRQGADSSTTVLRGEVETGGAALALAEGPRPRALLVPGEQVAHGTV